MTEGQVVRQVMDLLNILMAGGYCFYVRAVSSPGIGGEGRPRDGQPDITGWITDRREHFHGFAFECKGERGSENDEQTKNLEWARRAGGIGEYIWAIEEVFLAFEKAGVDIPIPYREALNELSRQRITRRLARARGRMGR